MKQEGALAEKTVGCAIVAGGAICVVSVGLMWVFGMGGVFRGTFTREPVTDRITDAGTLNLLPLMLVFFVLGLVLFGGGIAYGLLRTKADRTGVRRVEEYLRILARYAYDGPQLITSDWDIEAAENARFYVKALTREGVSMELETSLQVFYMCGEGQVGEGELQGRWLGKFVPYIGEPPTS